MVEKWPGPTPLKGEDPAITKYRECKQVADANLRQVGGAHYAGTYQHWDWVENMCLGYLPGNASKYVARWRKKNGIEDLEKAVHYLEKASASGGRVVSIDWSGFAEKETHNFAVANDLTVAECGILVQIALGNYANAISQIQAMIRRNEDARV